MRKLFFAGLVLSLLLPVNSAQAEEACKLMRLAMLAMDSDARGGATVPMSIDGHPLTMLVDTGGVYSSLSESTVNMLGLKSGPLKRVSFTAYGGVQLDQGVTVSNVRLGNLTGNKEQLLVFPDLLIPPGDAGTLAADYLSNYDVDFDFANAKLSLFSQHHCEGKVVYWTQDPSAIAKVEIELDYEHHITLQTQLDGEDVRAALDTGSSHSLMSLEWAESLFDLKEDSPGMKRLGAEGSQNPSYRYPFKMLALDGVTISNPDIVLVPDKVSGRHHCRFCGPDLILGMGVLRQLHLYIAYKEKRLYVTAATAH